MIRRFALIGSAIATLGPLPSVGAQIARIDPAKIDEIFAFTAGTKSPGCAVATVRDGKIEFARGYGMADLEHGTPITPTTAFNMASVSKQFTAAAINLLIADGRLSLDDDVRKYVPELPSFGAPIRIRHLLAHTSGLRGYDVLLGLAGETAIGISHADILKVLARQRRLNFAPGQQTAYSNSGYALLGIVVERVSGKSLGAFADERLFRPLGMTSTVFRDRNDTPIRNQALGYLQENGKWRLFSPAAGDVGPGGVFSTVEDLALWQHHLENPRLGGAKWRELTNALDTLSDGTIVSYGAGLGHGSFAGHVMLRHNGGMPAGTTTLIGFPGLRLSIAVLCNRVVPTAALARRIVVLYLGPDPDAVPPKVPRSAVRPTAQQMASYVGVFFNEQVPTIRTIALDGRELFYVQGPGNRNELAPLGGSRFQIMSTDTTARFLGPDTLRIEPARGSAKATLVRVSLARRDLRDYVGIYVSRELPARWKAQVADTGILLLRERGSPFRLDRAFEDVFRGPDFLMIARFIRDLKGEVVAMEINTADRVTHLRFERQH